jgi:hypothetical protein
MALTRVRKRDLVAALKAKAIAHGLTAEQVDTFERLYRGARTPEAQNEITRALELQFDGWRTANDSFSRVLQAASGIGELGDDDDEDPPKLKAALARSKVSVGRRR